MSETPSKFLPFGPSEDQDLLSGSVQHSKAEKYKPKDFLLIALLIFFIQGMGVLFPWNSFISAPDYFMAVFGDNIMTYFGVLYSIPNILSLAVMTLFGKHIPLTVATVPSYVVMFLALIAMPIAMYTPLMTLQTWGLIFTLAMVAVCGFMTATVQSGVFGFAGVMPNKYMTAVMSGNGVAGLLVALLRALTKFVIERNDSTEEQKLSVTIFFVIGSLVLIVCIFSYFILIRLPITRHFLAAASEGSKPSPTEDDEDPENEFDKIFRENTDTLYGNPLDEDSIIIPKEEKKTNVLIVFRKIWREALGICITFTISLCVFPGLSLKVPSKYDALQKGWLQVLVVIQFNLFDTIGRTAPMLSSKFNYICNKILDIPLLLRVFFIPLFYASLKFPETFLGNDIFVLCAMAVLSLTNGYFSSLLMTYAPAKVEPHEGRIAGTMMTFFLVGGIVLGTNLSNLINFVAPAN